MNDKCKAQDYNAELDTLGIEPRASRMLSGCDTITPCALIQELFLSNSCIIITQLLDMDTLGLEPRASRMQAGVIPLHHMPEELIKQLHVAITSKHL